MRVIAKWARTLSDEHLRPGRVALTGLRWLYITRGVEVVQVF